MVGNVKQEWCPIFLSDTVGRMNSLSIFYGSLQNHGTALEYQLFLDLLKRMINFSGLLIMLLIFCQLSCENFSMPLRSTQTE